MPYTIKQGLMKYKNPTSGDYESINSVSDQTTAEQIADIQGEGTTQIAAVQAKGEETLASIPSDYTELSSDVEDLKSAIERQASDLAPIIVSSDNIFYFSDTTPRTINGNSTSSITVEFPTRSSIKINGTLTINQYIGIMGGSEPPYGGAVANSANKYTGKYTLKKNTSGTGGGSSIRYGSSGAVGTAISSDSTVTLSDQYFSLRFPSGTYTNYVVEIMLVSGETAEEFLPYGTAASAIDSAARSAAENTVKYISQSLTDEQKLQARTNIGSTTEAYVDNKLDEITEISDNRFYFTDTSTRTLGSVSDPTKRITVEFPTKSSIKINGELSNYQYIGIMGGSDAALGSGSYSPDAYSGDYALIRNISGSAQFTGSSTVVGLRYGDSGATGTSFSNGSTVTLDNKYFSFRFPAGIYTDYVVETMLVEGESPKQFVPYGKWMAVDNAARSAASSAVLFAAQTLTDAQKTQARTNIGALGADSESASVLANALISKCNLVTPKKILTWIDDDTSSVAAIESVMTICEALGIRCTFATITHNWTSAITTKLIEAQDAGYHIASHGHSSHTFWRESNALALDGDLALSIRELQQAGFLDADMFVYPGNSVDRQDVDVPGVIAKWCRCGVKDYLNSTYCTGYGQGRYKINRKFIDKSSHSTVSYYTDLLDALSEDSAPWYVYGTHSSHSSEFDADLVSGVLSYALQNGWTVMPLNQAFRYRERYYTIQEMFGLN